MARRPYTGLREHVGSVAKTNLNNTYTHVRIYQIFSLYIAKDTDPVPDAARPGRGRLRVARLNNHLNPQLLPQRLAIVPANC